MRNSEKVEEFDILKIGGPRLVELGHDKSKPNTMLAGGSPAPLSNCKATFTDEWDHTNDKR